MAASVVPSAQATQKPYEEDVQFALETLQENCGRFFELKGIDWAAVSKEFTKEAKSVKTEQQHLVLLTRLLARLGDGHATVEPRDKTRDARWPEDGKGERTGCAMFWCRACELPSGLFALYVSVASNKGCFNGGRGIEGIGVVPHELVEYDLKDLAADRNEGWRGSLRHVHGSAGWLRSDADRASSSARAFTRSARSCAATRRTSSSMRWLSSSSTSGTCPAV